MVEYRRNALREDGAHLPAAHPGSVMGGTPASHSSRHCGNQRRTGGSPLEEVRCFDCSSYAYSLMKHYTSAVTKAAVPGQHQDFILATRRVQLLAQLTGGLHKALREVIELGHPFILFPSFLAGFARGLLDPGNLFKANRQSPTAHAAQPLERHQQR